MRRRLTLPAAHAPPRAVSLAPFALALILPLALALATGCLSHPGQLEATPQQIPARDSLFLIDAARTDSVAVRGAVDGTLAWLASDAVYLRGGLPPVYGRDAIGAMLASAPLAVAGLPVWQPLGGAISADRHAGYTFGIAARPTPKGATAIRFERYIAFWERTATSPWRVVAYAEIGAGSATAWGGMEGTVAPGPRGSPAARRAVLSLVRVDSNFADRSSIAGTPAAFASVMAPDGITFTGPELVVGPEAERDLLESQRASLIWHPVYGGIAGSGDLGYTIGLYVSTGRGATGAAVQRFGKYISVWRRDRNGVWKLVVDGGNPAPSPGGG